MPRGRVRDVAAWVPAAARVTVRVPGSPAPTSRHQGRPGALLPSLMPVASVRFLTSDGVAHDLFAGDVIGRVWHAALQILDPRISEFHACVSLRGGELVLLPLRGTIRLGGVAVKALRLQPGLSVELVAGVTLTVRSLDLPDHLPAVSLDGGEAQPIDRTGCSIRDGALLPGLREDADATLWTDGERWYLARDGASVEVAPGFSGEVGGQALRLLLVETDEAGVSATAGRPGSPPLHMVVRYDTVQIQPIGRDVTILSGMAARLLSELAQLGGSAHWEVVARELWRSDLDKSTLRVRWDKTLRTLRRKLDAAELPPELVRSTGGYCGLVLRPHDSLDLDL